MNFNEKCLLVIYGIILIFISYYVIEYFKKKIRMMDRESFSETKPDKIVNLNDYMKYRYGENIESSQCKCRPYLDQQLYSGDDSTTCRYMLEDLLIENKDLKGSKVSSNTEVEFLNWCNSYRRRLYMYPKYYDAKEKFLMFHHTNLYTE